MRGITLIEILIVIAILGIAAIVFLGGSGIFTSPDDRIAYNALQAQGFSDITITDHSNVLVGYRGCGSDDSMMFEATARNPAGRVVPVIVCSGWPFKGATIRTP